MDQMHAAAENLLYALACSARKLLRSGESPSWATAILAYTLQDRATYPISQRTYALTLAAAATFIANNGGTGRELSEP